MWAPADDYYLPEYIKKNIDILESDETVVSSTSDFRWFYVEGENNVEEQVIKNKRTDWKSSISYYGTRDERVNSFLKNFGTFEMYAVHRTDKLKEGFISNTFWMWDHACALNMIKHGNYHALDEILTYKYTKGIGRGILNSISNQNVPLLHIIFLSYPFISWITKTFGIKIFLKFRRYFFNVFLRGQYIVAAESLRMLKRMAFGKEKNW